MTPNTMFNSLSLDTAHVAETLGVMLQKERRIARINYFQKYSSSLLLLESSVGEVVNEQDRTEIVDWCYTFVDECNVGRECVALAMNMVDQFLSKPTTSTHEYLSSRKQYQLLCLTALYTTIKIHEPIIIGSEIAMLCNGLYSIQDVEDMEMTLLMGLEWCIHSPTSIQIAYSILSLILPRVTDTLPESSWVYLLDEVLYQTECAVSDYELSVLSRPSTVAFTSILNALRGMDNGDRQAILQALLFVIDEFGGMLASTQELQDAKRRLQSIVPQDNIAYHISRIASSQEEQQEHDGEECVSVTPTITPSPDSSYTDVQEFGAADDLPPTCVYISHEYSSSLE